jgi:hypothetical protein
MGPSKGLSGAEKTGQLIQSMGPILIEVCIHVQRASTPSKRAFITFFRTILLPHMYYLRCICYKLPVSKYISLLCRLKVNHKTEIWNMCLFSGPTQYSYGQFHCRFATFFQELNVGIHILKWFY